MLGVRLEFGASDYKTLISTTTIPFSPRVTLQSITQGMLSGSQMENGELLY